MTSLITSQCDVKVAWLQEMDTDSAYMSKSQYMQSYWFSNKSNNKIIYNISVMTITITIIIILTNFGKYAISDCLFITCQNLILASMFVGRVCYLPKFTFWQVCSLVVFVCLFVCTEISQNLKNDSINHHQTWSQASTSPWFLQVRWTRM